MCISRVALFLTAVVAAAIAALSASPGQAEAGRRDEDPRPAGRRVGGP